MGTAYLFSFTRGQVRHQPAVVLEPAGALDCMHLPFVSRHPVKRQQSQRMTTPQTGIDGLRNRQDLDAFNRQTLERAGLGSNLPGQIAYLAATRPMAGYVTGATGVINTSSGDFTCSRTGVGAYTIAFDDEWSVIWSAIAGCSQASAATARTENLATTGFNVVTFTTAAGAAADRDFSFVAYGIR